MEKIVIKAISKYDGVNHLKIEKNPYLNVNLCAFLKDLGFDSEKIKDLDLSYAEMEDEYLFSKDKKLKIHLFITKASVHLVLESDLNEGKFNKILEKYFKLKN